jgi:hypothetical protein
MPIPVTYTAPSNFVYSCGGSSVLPLPSASVALVGSDHLTVKNVMWNPNTNRALNPNKYPLSEALDSSQAQYQLTPVMTGISTKCDGPTVKLGRGFLMPALKEPRAMRDSRSGCSLFFYCPSVPPKINFRLFFTYFLG